MWRSIRTRCCRSGCSRARRPEVSWPDIPVIDIAIPSGAETRRAIDAACREWGFFQVVGHGIDGRVIAALQQQMRAFFAQPLAAKHAIVRTAENPWGFYDRELTRHTPDWKQIYDFGPPDGAAIVPQWPASLPEFRPAIESFYDACDALALRILGAIAAQSRHARATRWIWTSGTSTPAFCG